MNNGWRRWSRNHLSRVMNLDSRRRYLMDRDVLLAVATAVDEDGQEKEQDDDDQEED